jgi:hypothetical protein
LGRGRRFFSLARRSPPGARFQAVAYGMVLLLIAIVGVFIEISIVSDYVFWVMEANIS